MTPATSEDEGLLLVYPLQVLHGHLPYRDFMSAYGPGETYLLAGLYWLFSPSVLVERAVGLLSHLAIAGAVYALYRKRGRRLAASLAACSGLLLVPLANLAFAYLQCVAFSLWAVVAARHGTRRGLLIAGALAGLSVTWRPDTALLALLPQLPLLWPHRRRLKGWLLGLTCGLAPTFLVLALMPGPFLSSIRDRALQGAGESRLPIPPVFADERHLFFVLVAATAIVLLWASRPGRTRAAASLGLFSLLIAPQALQRCDATHLLFASTVTVPVAVAAAHERLRSIAPLRLAAGALAVLAALTPVVAAPSQIAQPWVAAMAGPYMAAPVVKHDGRQLPVHDIAQARQIRQVLAAVDQHAPTGSTVFVTYRDLVRPLFADISLYYLMPGLRIVAHNLEITPGVTNQPPARLDRDIATADVVVLEGYESDLWKRLFPYSHAGWSKPSQVLRRQFCSVLSVGAYHVYVRCPGAKR